MTVFICLILILILWTSNHVPNTCPDARTFPSFAEMKNISSFSSKGRKVEEKKLKCFFPLKWCVRVANERAEENGTRNLQVLWPNQGKPVARRKTRTPGFSSREIYEICARLTSYSFRSLLCLNKFWFMGSFQSRVSQADLFGHCSVCSLLITITKGFLTISVCSSPVWVMAANFSPSSNAQEEEFGQATLWHWNSFGQIAYKFRIKLPIHLLKKNNHKNKRKVKSGTEPKRKLFWGIFCFVGKWRKLHKKLQIKLIIICLVERNAFGSGRVSLSVQSLPDRARAFNSNWRPHRSVSTSPPSLFIRPLPARNFILVSRFLRSAIWYGLIILVMIFLDLYIFGKTFVDFADRCCFPVAYTNYPRRFHG